MPSMRHRVRSQRLVALFAAGWLTLNFPLLTLWDRDVSVGGWPLLPTALFVGWAVLIGLAAWVSEATDAGPPQGGGAPPRGAGAERPGAETAGEDG